jgi:hypothetical protein
MFRPQTTIAQTSLNCQLGRWELGFMGAFIGTEGKNLVICESSTAEKSGFNYINHDHGGDLFLAVPQINYHSGGYRSYVTVPK